MGIQARKTYGDCSNSREVLDCRGDFSRLDRLFRLVFAMSETGLKLPEVIRAYFAARLEPLLELEGKAPQTLATVAGTEHPRQMEQVRRFLAPSIIHVACSS